MLCCVFYSIWFSSLDPNSKSWAGQQPSFKENGSACMEGWMEGLTTNWNWYPTELLALRERKSRPSFDMDVVLEMQNGFMFSMHIMLAGTYIYKTIICPRYQHHFYACGPVRYLCASKLKWELKENVWKKQWVRETRLLHYEKKSAYKFKIPFVGQLEWWVNSNKCLKERSSLKKLTIKSYIWTNNERTTQS